MSSENLHSSAVTISALQSTSNSVSVGRSSSISESSSSTNHLRHNNNEPPIATNFPLGQDEQQLRAQKDVKRGRWRRLKVWERSKKLQEIKEAIKELILFLKNHDYKKTIKASVRRKYWGWWILLAIIIILSAILSSYHDKITKAIQPYQEKIKNTPGAWIIPTVLLIVVSFPPLLGHEIIILISGMIWGTWIGFGIACAGTFLGELATYYAFKHLIRNKSEEIENKSITYATLARLMREGGLMIVILVRASALPGHITTAIQASIGISVWIFSVACFITLPKQFAIVYLGALITESNSNKFISSNNSDLPDQPPGISQVSEQQKSIHHTISVLVFLVTILFTFVSAYLVWMRMRRIRPLVEADFLNRNKSSEKENGWQDESEDGRKSLVGIRNGEMVEMIDRKVGLAKQMVEADQTEKLSEEDERKIVQSVPNLHHLHLIKSNSISPPSTNCNNSSSSL
ncbi:expressed protein [Phakopsora pachyrhizi]|uniref:Golgi apparatus membrane protein TVP38 n=1 Tax=Phakopsora pachyrhizi TaxID=170000 RepID=A0AAV0BSR9_PHAPC|nr:expressed protein [Phakopsora pachyrhizi]